MPMLNIRENELKTVRGFLNFILYKDTKGNYLFDLNEGVFGKAELESFRRKVDSEYAKILKKDEKNFDKLQVLLSEATFET